jgi:4a-hydroxytetrahydrobiopterin dehydratase
MERPRAEQLLCELDEGWGLNADGHLQRTYSFSNFVEAIAFANRVGEIAEAQNHHPDLHVAWGKCTTRFRV